MMTHGTGLLAADSLVRQAREIKAGASIAEVEVFDDLDEGMCCYISLDTGDTLFTSFTDASPLTPERRLRLQLLFNKAVLHGLNEASLDLSADYLAHAIDYHLDGHTEELVEALQQPETTTYLDGSSAQ